jgi:hypothetical protein
MNPTEEFKLMSEGIESRDAEKANTHAQLLLVALRNGYPPPDGHDLMNLIEHTHQIVAATGNIMAKENRKAAVVNEILNFISNDSRERS